MHEKVMRLPLDRRMVIGMIPAAALGLPALRVAAQATPSATPAGNDGVQPDGSWRFVDDAGETVAQDALPERIVAEMASAASLWDFGIHAIGAWGAVERADGSREVTAGEVDLDAVELLGEGFEDFDVERLVALQPDLAVTTMYGPAGYWRLDEAMIPRVRQIAPLAGIELWAVPVTRSIRRFEALAGALGAELASGDVADQRAAFEQASGDVRAAVAENPGLKILVVSGADDMFYVAHPEVAGDLMYFRELGVDIVVPDAPPEYWESLSWEQAMKYPADVILVDRRLGSLPLEQMLEFPTFASHPAVVAGQTGAWDVEYVVSYKGFTPVLQNLAKTIRESRADVVD
jgi:iron complex transport system substrate-binding protein